ncbi:MAG: class I SAM-dependent methyltransferase [Candidatus Omnitrophica bacterium]|nr:class I SAM-dependent methyltransferase [Candidatus Omnitrophota bacterium]
MKPRDGGQIQATTESEIWEEAYQNVRRSMGRRKQLLGFFDWIGEEKTVLDLGTGDGLDIQALEEMGHKRFIGFDISHNLLQDSPHKGVVGDAHKIPFRDGSIDIVLANSVIHHFDFPRMASEIVRVLKPGGLFCYLEQRPTLARSILDWFTMQKWVGTIIPYLKHRRIALSEEIEDYTGGLENYPRIARKLLELGMDLEREKKTLLGVLAQWRKKPKVPGGFSQFNPD